jgi:hypothetical protein
LQRIFTFLGFGTTLFFFIFTTGSETENSYLCSKQYKNNEYLFHPLPDLVIYRLNMHLSFIVEVYVLLVPMMFGWRKCKMALKSWVIDQDGMVGRYHEKKAPWLSSFLEITFFRFR